MKKLMAFVVTLIGISSFASSYRDGFVINDVEWGYVVANGKAQICDVRAKGGAWLTGAVSVPNEVAGYEVTEIGSQAFKNESKITSISIPDGVRLVGSSAFSGCAALQSVSFPASLESVGKNAFEMCVLLKEITLPSGVRRIEDNTFDGCSSLEVVGMPAELEAIGSYAFQKCSSLKSISIPLSVVKIGTKAFDGCSNLGSGMVIVDGCVLTFNGTCAENVAVPEGTRLIGGGAFSGHSEIKSVSLPDGLTIIGASAFSSCSSLSTINIPESVLEIGRNAFSSCTGLGEGLVIRDGCVLRFTGTCPSEISIPDGTRVISGGVFYQCRDLTSISIPSTVVSIGDYAFGYCDRLQSITLPASLKRIGDYAFYYCSSITSPIDFPTGVEKAGEFAFASCEKLTEVKLGQGLKFVAKGTFSGCSKLAKLSLPESIAVIEDSAFRNTALTSLTTPQGLTRIGSSAFEFCSALKSVTLNDKLELIGDTAFRNCTALTSIVIPSSVKCIGASAFSWCNAITEVSFLGGGMVVGDSAFCPCDAVRKIMVQDIADFCSIKFCDSASNPYAYYAASLYLKGEKVNDLVIPNGVEEIGAYVFGGMNDIRSVTIPPSVKKVGWSAFCTGGSNPQAVYIEDLAAWSQIEFAEVAANPLFFAGKLYLNGNLISGELRIPDGVKRIGSYAFAECKGITALILPEGLEEIGQEAFKSCGSLRSIDIPASLLRIGSWAFYNCGSLGTVNVSDIGSWMNVELADLYSNPGGYSSSSKLLVNGVEVAGDLVIPEGVTTVGFGMFKRSERLTSVTLPQSVTNIENQAFQHCMGLRKVVLPDGLIRIGEKAFEDCWDLESLNMPEGVQEVGKNAFYSCYRVEPFSLPKGLGKIEYSAFEYCNKFENIRIPSGVTNVASYAFAYCKGLTTVYIPKSVKTISQYAFSGCSNLTRVLVDSGDTSRVSRMLSDSGLSTGGITFVVTSFYQVVFDLGVHGIRSGGGVLTQTVERGMAATEPIVSAEDGWEFVGWSGSFDSITSNITIEALYDPIAFEIVYENVDGAENDNPTSYTVEDSILFSPLASRDDARFVGWTPARIDKGSMGRCVVVANWERKGVSDLLPRFKNVSSAGQSPWFTVWDGSRWSIQSGKVGNREASTLCAEVTGAGTLEFSWKVSSCCEEGYQDDYLSLSIDGKEVSWIGGEQDWRVCEVTLGATPSSHSITWTYSKDKSDSAGADCGWIAGVTWTPNAIVADIGELVSIFGSDSDIAKYLRDEKTLEDFNVFLSSCGVASADQITAAQKQYAYQSFKLSEITTAPRLFEDEPVLKIDDLELTGGNLALTISLTAGAEAIQLAKDKLAEKIRVGTSVNSIIDKPVIDTTQSKDGTSVTFSFAPPKGGQGFVRVKID